MPFTREPIGRPWTLLVVGSVALFSAIWIWTLFGNPAVSPVFQVNATQSLYSVGTPIRLTLTLTQPPSSKSSTTWRVCTFGAATVRVKTITRDGSGVAAIFGTSDYITEPELLQDSYIQTLTSGDMLGVPWAVGVDTNGNALLDDISLEGDYSVYNPFTHTATEVPKYVTRTFLLDKPGLYTIQLQYKYSGSLPDVFNKSLDSNVLTVQIQ